LPKDTLQFATIKDVGRLAGVSIATVSGVINGKTRVSVAVKERVEEAMKALDYHPDHMARSLKTGRSQVIGMVVPDLSNPFFVEVMCGVEDTARKLGYSVIFSNSNENPSQERANLAMLHSQRVQGVVLVCSDGHAAYDRLTTRRFPIVFVDRLPMAGFSGRAVVVDNAGAAYEGTRYLIGLGHKDIAIIAARPDFSNGFERVEGFRKAMAEASYPVRADYYRLGDFSLESGYQCGMELLRLPQPPTAIFTCNNKMTLGTVQAVREAGVRCPDDVSLLAFDDFPWAAHFHPRLTVLAQPSHDLGREAMLMLINGMAEEGGPQPCRVTLSAELRVRESTAPPARSSQRVQSNSLRRNRAKTTA
jgi:LacI family transcriptional regulator